MCGISGIFGQGWHAGQLDAMVAAQRHRGPDDTGSYQDADGCAGLGHNRLSIIDLSRAGRQPMTDREGRFWLVFNGEVYNYRELRAELADYPYRSRSDAEVVLAAYARWGARCLDRFVGMFAFLLWDSTTQELFAARDRFGVKPLYYCADGDGTLWAASEIKALHAGGVPAEPDPVAWASYLASGAHDHSERTFWRDVRSLPPGHALRWARGRLEVSCWYDLAARVGPDFDSRPEHEVEDEYRALLGESVSLRFRSDVPVGINLSGGLDSSTLLGLVHEAEGAREVQAFTFTTEDPAYDELPWVRSMLEGKPYRLVVCPLRPEDVPALAASVQYHEDEPFGGLPTLAYARLFERARDEGVTVLLDGQGMDEQWAGYDYYGRAGAGPVPLMQGARERAVRPECLVPEFRALSVPLEVREAFPDRLRNLQYRDACYTKIPKALRFNDRASMRASRELREPFLDHRLLELALRQPADRKIAGGVHKRLLRRIARRLMPAGISEAPKRPVQTPQREWLRGPLRGWAREQIEIGLECAGGTWLDPKRVREAWKDYVEAGSDNSFYVWQWLSLGLASVKHAAVCQPLG